LGLADRGALRRFFAGGDSMMRLNQYPPCRQPHLALGTGPHTDPTSLTLLHQDDVGGLQVRVARRRLLVRFSWSTSATPSPR
jgi:gibberellin-44 dioxygenase